MADWDDVRRLALAMPEAREEPLHGLTSWRVRGKLFVWERPLRRPDLEALGDTAPEGPILGARVESPVAKQALLADPSGVYFTIPHFDGYNAVLVRLPDIGEDDLEELVAAAWLVQAPKRVARAWWESHRPQR